MNGRKDAGDMSVQVQTRAYFAPKDGNAPDLWEDGCAWSERRRKLLVADGASSGWRSYDWVDLLVDRWLQLAPPADDTSEVHRWLSSCVAAWPALVAEQQATLAESGQLAAGLVRLADTTAFATVLLVDVDDGAQDGPRWQAGALGDTCLFHLRGEELLAAHPIASASDFGRRPDGVPSDPEGLAVMLERWRVAQGPLRHGDVLLGATDALAKWALAEASPDVWPTLSSLDHESFQQLVTELRALGGLENDDVTLAIVDVVVS